MFLQWNTATMMYTRAELTKLHKHFWRPYSGKLFNLLKRIKPEDTNPETLAILKKIQDLCRTCMVFRKGQHRFRVSLPKGDCAFNHEVAMYLILQKENPALHVVDTHTHFSAAIFIPTKSTKDIWNAFIACWASAYVGYPDIFRLDQESAFTGRELFELASSAGFEVKLFGIQSHNAIGVGERYHARLRNILLHICEDVPDI